MKVFWRTARIGKWEVTGDLEESGLARDESLLTRWSGWVQGERRGGHGAHAADAGCSTREMTG